MLTPQTVEFEWKGLNVQVRLEELGYEGDPTIPGGTRSLGMGVTELWVWTPSDEDLTDHLTEKTVERLGELALRRI